MNRFGLLSPPPLFIPGASIAANPTWAAGQYGLDVATATHTTANAKGAWTATPFTLSQAIDHLSLRAFNSASRLFLLDIRSGGANIVVQDVPISLGATHQTINLDLRIPAGSLEYRVATNNSVNGTLELYPLPSAASIPNANTLWTPVASPGLNPVTTGVAITAANAPAWTTISAAGLASPATRLQPYLGGNNVGAGRLAGTAFLELGTSPDGVTVTVLGGLLPLTQTASAVGGERFPIIRGNWPTGTYFHARVYMSGSPTASDVFNCQIHTGRA